MHIDCEKPCNILNPHLKDNILKHGNYYLDGEKFVPLSSWYECFPMMKFRTIMKRTDSEIFENYYVLDGNGNQLPLFLSVPCGKCDICKDRKAKEWSCRAMCESQSSSSIPYFVTLTYNDNCLPSNGVRKGACQRFMKRLRINYERLTGKKSTIRYFICAEYGSKTKRPHYHALLWNLDILNPTQIVDLVQKSWSFAVSPNYYKQVPDIMDVYGKPIYKFMDGKTPRCLYGYIKVSPITEGRVRYCMKYMRKDSDIPCTVDSATGELKLMNNTFFLSSRRGGLGKEWIDNKLQEYRDNPSLLNVVLVDKWSGEMFQGVMPTYFKNIIAPPPSRIISKEIRDAFKEYSDLYVRILKESVYVNSYYERVVDHYPTLYLPCTQYKTNVSSNVITSMVKDMILRCDELEYMLLSYDYDKDLAQFSPQYKLNRVASAKIRLQNKPILSPPDKISRLKRERLRQLHREIF